jgi:phage shock protein C
MNEPANGTKRLYRLKDRRIVAGVCTGLAAFIGIDATLVRLGFALLTAFGGVGALI